MNFRRAYDPGRALSNAWKLLWKAPLSMFLGGVLLMVTGGGGPNGSWQFDDGDFNFGALESAAIASLIGFGCLIGVGLFVFNSLLRVGFGAAVQRVMTTGKEDVADLFRPRGLLLSMIVSQILVVIVIFLAAIPFGLAIGGGFLVAGGTSWPPVLVISVIAFCVGWFVVWIWVILGLSLVPEAISIEGLGPIDALERSWSLTTGYRLELFLYSVVMFLVSIAGLLACCVGLLVTGPWTYIAWYESYVRLTQPKPEGGFWIDRPTGIAATE